MSSNMNYTGAEGSMYCNVLGKTVSIDNYDGVINANLTYRRKVELPPTNKIKMRSYVNIIIQFIIIIGVISGLLMLVKHNDNNFVEDEDFTDSSMG